MSRFDSTKANESVQAFLTEFEALKQGLLTLQTLQMRLNPLLVGLWLTGLGKSFLATSES